MTLHIQDPAKPDTDYLVDKLVEACRGAKSGGGAFAFLSAGGVKLLLRNEEFSAFLEQSPFHLLVGVDAITDMAAVAELTKVQQVRPNLLAKVFIPTSGRSIFHPKMAWFDTGKGGVLITGSGNLTVGGLRMNIEAFSVETLDPEGIEQVRAQWDAYVAMMAACQLDPMDPGVAALLQRNAARRQAMRAAGITEPGGPAEAAEAAAPHAAEGPGTGVITAAPVALPEQPTDVLPKVEGDTAILIAEIPRSGNRWRQANFDQATFFGFFGASRSVQRQVYFFHVRDDGTLGFQEVRPAVAVVSQNYRFELEAASGLDYPDDGKPIGVFAKIAARTFAYMLLMPASSGHKEMEALLNSSAPAQVGRMRRMVFPAAIAKSAWPTSPLWGQLTV